MKQVALEGFLKKTHIHTHTHTHTHTHAHTHTKTYPGPLAGDGALCGISY